MKIYVASSWRNEQQPKVVARLRESHHEVYDFKENETAFHWSHIDSDWEHWTPEQLTLALKHPLAEAGYKADNQAMEWADIGVLVLPCGPSAHLEAGYFYGAGKPLHILLDSGEPELAYKMATRIHTNMWQLINAIYHLERRLLQQGTI